MTARTYFFAKSESDLRLFLPGLIISAACHILIFVGLIFAPGLNFQKKLQPTPINVSLVSIPAPYFTPPAKKKTKTASAQPKKAVEKPAKVSTAEKPAIEKPVQEEFKPKASLKKKTFKTGKVVENAIKEIEKKVEDSKPDPLAQALERIKKTVESSRPEKMVESSKPEMAEEDGQDETDREMTGVTGGQGNRSFDKIDLYQLEIKYQIQKNWAFSEQLAGKHNNLESILVIKIMPNGEIKDVWFEKKSGNNHLDESARKAILKSDPLPPLPPEINRPFFTVGMIFTPSGLQ